jgi:hypothetical protein
MSIYRNLSHDLPDSSAHKINTNAQAAQELSAQVEAFLQQGGSIQTISSGQKVVFESPTINEVTAMARKFKRMGKVHFCPKLKQWVFKTGSGTHFFHAQTALENWATRLKSMIETRKS